MPPESLPVLTESVFLCSNGHVPRGPGLACTRMSPFWKTRAKDDGGGGETWSYKTCKAPVKSSAPTNQHPAVYRPDAFAVKQCQGTEG